MTIETIELDSAAAFLESISLENKQHDGYLSSYIFRGQANSDWPIVPSAFRKNTVLFRKKHSPLKISQRTHRDQVESEYFMLHSFCMELQNSGLYIPNETILTRHDYSDEFIDFHNKIGRGELLWPAPEYLSIIALAQHYGLPTRFTDWTLDPFVAAYFAITSWMTEKSKPEHISVFALNTIFSDVTNYGFDRHIKGLSPESPEKSYQVVRSPSFFNDHLRAQKGLFLAYIQRKFRPNEKAEAFSVEDHLANVANKKSDIFVDIKPLAYKYILNKKHCKEAFRIIQKRGYTASRIFPGISGCIKSIYESIST
ncbi:FRG domain-containing protein [Pseudomonas citronellolis]|uniref:FRG domain-containing protein n=1 Tax=Pseudomonas citronellolis TaxID=53408 RepID=UPI002D773E5D|nr:FRG domain-containing protein [Pseudomonas citronellolis]WRT80730.1 FRG domain-containing protein [Pseudomonas citronellolis]